MGPSEIANDRFSNKKMDAFALSSALAFWVAGSGRVGDLLFRPHAQQRARASRGQKVIHEQVQ